MPTTPGGAARPSRHLAAPVLALLLLAGAGIAAWFATRSGDEAPPGAAETASSSAVATTTVSSGEDVPAVDDAAADVVALDVLGPGEVPPAVVGSFDLGPVQPVASGVVGPAGGRVEGLDDMTIEVPAGVHDAEQPYEVSKQEILGHDFTNGLVPVSALYSVDNGGGLADEPIRVEIPAEVPSGGFAMGFLYDPETRGLEALPLVAVGTDSVVVATGHFSHVFVHGIDAAAFASMVGVDAALDAARLLDTGFRPGVDDWSFDNHGSFVHPSGHCAGQALSSMWYFLERRRLGAPGLHERYDNDGLGATALWEDDRDGYRLASGVQTDYVDHPLAWIEGLQREYDDWRAEQSPDSAEAADYDVWQYASFLAAMQITGEPQFVVIGRLTSSGSREGHAMVVYGADVAGLLVADPNHAGSLRRIPWNPAESTLGPYWSGPNAEQQGDRYDSISLIGKTATVDWAGIGRRFADADAGNSGDDVFGQVRIEVLETDAQGVQTWVPLTDDFVTYGVALDLRVVGTNQTPWKLSQCDRDWCWGGGSGSQPSTAVILEEGNNHLALYVEAESAPREWRFLDFVRTTVYRGAAVDVDITPELQTVAVGDPVTFTVDVANQLGTEIAGLRVYADRTEQCGSRTSVPGGGDHSVTCTLGPFDAPGVQLIDVDVYPDPYPRAQFVTEITVVEPTSPPGETPGGILEALDGFIEQIGLESDPAREVPIAPDPTEYATWLTADPVPLAVYTVHGWARVHVGAYASEDEAQEAFDAIATEASSGLSASPTGAHWCDWYRDTFDRYRFHGADAFIRSTVFLAPDGDSNVPGAQVPGNDVAFVDDILCQYSRAEAESSYGYPIVEDAEHRMRAWVQGTLVVTMRSHWSDEQAEVLHAELAAVLGN